MESVEAERFFVGKLEHFLFRAAAGDDRLARGVVAVGDSAAGAFCCVDHSFDDIFFEGAEREFNGEFFYGGVWEDAFCGADGDVMGAGGIEWRDADFADQDGVALRADVEYVVNPFGAFVERGLGDYVEGFEREGCGFCAGE